MTSLQGRGFVALHFAAAGRQMTKPEVRTPAARFLENINQLEDVE